MFCAQIGDLIVRCMSLAVVILACSLWPVQHSNAQITIIPDTNFEQALIDLAIDSDGIVNGEVLTNDINAVTNLDVFNRNISDLTGIQDFTGLEILNCSGNRLTNLDINSNLNLTQVNCSSNLLTFLDLSNNTGLAQLNCNENIISTLDVASNTALKALDITDNQIDNMSVTTNLELTSLKCANNRLSNLDISGNLMLTELICSSNLLTSLDVSANTELTTLFSASNQLSFLDITKNDSLIFLDCSNNQISALDVSSSALLEQLTCSANQLTNLNVSQNDSLQLLALANNQIQALDVSENRKLENLVLAANLLTELNVRDNNFLKSIDFSFNLIEHINLDNNDSLQSVNGSGNQLFSFSIKNDNNSALNTLNLLNNPNLLCINIDDESQVGMTWLKDNTAVYATDCAPLQTSVPDANFELALIALGLDTGPVDGFVVTDSIKGVTFLDVAGEDIADLTGIADFSNLADLNCSNNLLTRLDLTQNTLLTAVNCSGNQLASLIIKNNNNEGLVTFDSRNNGPLNCIAIDDVSFIGALWLKDGSVSYANNCMSGSTFVPDHNFEQALIDAGIDAGVLDNYVSTAAVATITALDVSDKQIEDLTGIESFTALDSLDCSSNLLFNINLSQNTLLTNFICHTNFISQLDISANTALVALNCGNNRLKTLDVTANTVLERLIVDSNFLTTIDLTPNGALMVLNVNSNNINSPGFDLSGNTGLKELYCSNNNITTLDIGQNTLMKALDFANNRVLDVDLSQNTEMENLNCSRNFLNALDLTTNVLLDTLEANGNRFTTLSFTTNPMLLFISAENNALTTIDLSNNAGLRTLLLAGNNLNAIDLSNKDLLSILHVGDNALTTLDVTTNSDLLDLSLKNNQVTSLDLSNNTALLNLACDNNQLTALDIIANTDLLAISLSSNEITGLDVSANSLLTSLTCNDNALTALELSVNPDLELLTCSRNAIEGLDLSMQPKLTSLNCSANSLETLNIRNGNNANLGTLNAINNPGLYCIEVDDIGTIGESWQKDDVTSFSENCHYADIYVPDDNFESALAEITGQPDNNDDYIVTASIISLTSLNVSGRSITDITGIQNLTALESLDVSNNLIDSLYLIDLINLKNLDVSNNMLDSIDLSTLNMLETLDVSANQLNGIELENLSLLTELSCDNNNFINLDLGTHTALIAVTCSANQLTNLNIKNGNNNLLTVFNALDNPELFCIEVDDPENIGEDWSKDEAAAYSMDCHYNETYVPDDAFEGALIMLGLDETSSGPLDNYIPTSKALQTISLNIAGKGITNLTGIENFINLVSLNCSNNKLGSLAIQYNTKLEVLNCSANLLTSLELMMADSLKTLNASGNSLTSLDVSHNSILNTIRFSANKLNSIDISQNKALTTVNGQFNNLFTVDADNGANDILSIFDTRNNPNLTCILVDDVLTADGHQGWYKDDHSQYKLVCDDDDNDGVKDSDDICPATPFGSEVDLFGCTLFTLPASNFTVRTTSESCRGGNNGKINIFAEKILPYTATLTSETDSISNYDFGDQVEIRNVRAGRYLLCITVAGQSDYAQCYSLLITEPEDLKVLQTGRTSNGRVAYEMKGSSKYEINFNGRTFETNENNISIILKPGKNTIRIKTKADCQGVFEQTLFYTDKTMAFPNPFYEQLQVGLAHSEAKAMRVNIYSITGTVQFSENYLNNGREVIPIDTSAFPEGVYLLEVIEETGEQIRFKIVKR